MYGPMPRGTWMRGPGEGFGGLRPGARYRVVQAFVDFDRVTHPVGETWTFLGHNFLPYDAGLSLFVSLDGEHEWHIRMQDDPEQQSAIIADLARHVAELAP